MSQDQWGELVPASYDPSRLYICQESPASAAVILRKQGYFTDDRLNRLVSLMHSEERIVWDGFVNDDYGPDMHLLTLRDKTSHFVCGVVFWRDLEREEMKEWIDDTKLKHSQLLESRDEKRQLTSSSNSSAALSSSQERQYPTIIPPSVNDKELYESWIKIELVATHKSRYGQRVGTILLAAALLYAIKMKKKHSVVHVAGGEDNIAASKLYRRFGFQSPEEQVFNKPNNFLNILWNIREPFAKRYPELEPQMPPIEEEDSLEGPESLVNRLFCGGMLHANQRGRRFVWDSGLAAIVPDHAKVAKNSPRNVVDK
ncbi:hypothetical protein PROFUN_06058 [Planoprotostelium fungivorum]|uniref:N-acetyltransferase domain-containing protein n=1 Tax=Planoprotostelium fungivorum TaxID=1890364 RepID=A0A2P6NPQ1_9EUKA|nr:hypothetical protein PROFUN_06058 [Planoprotostelium fungivorum]